MLDIASMRDHRYPMPTLSKSWAAAFAVLSFSSVAIAETFDALTFRSIGPAVMGGRIDAIAVVESEPSTMYVGTASGGLWKTENHGTTWLSLFDHVGSPSIGDVVVSALDPSIVWVGTGEPNNRQSSSYGDGVYKSLDGGRRFMHVGLEETRHIGKVVIHPNDPERVYVAALGNLWGAGEERGVFRTLDGGKSWDKVLFVDEDTGVSTLAMDPVNPDVLYAAAYQRRRTPLGFAGGGPGSGLYKTVDGGDSWSRLSEGLPEGDLGRIGMAVFRRDPNVVFALIEHKSEGGLYRSRDRGESWTKINDLNPRPMYYSKIFVDPTDVERVYVLGSSFHVSDDGGHTFETNRDMTPTYDVGVHGDHHYLWIDPKNSKHLVLGGDGGLYFSWDRSVSWTKINNLPIAQFYAIAVDMDEPYNVYGGAQDTHSWMGPSATRNQIGILNGDWVQTNFGDGMYQQADPTDPSIVYTESQGGNLVRLDRRTGNRKAIKPYPDENETDYRFHWTSPMVISRHNPATLYFGGNRLFISSDRGDSWTASPELTRNEDRDELEIMGAIPDEDTLSRHDGVADWGTITTISESPIEAGTVYVGTDDGRIQLTRDGGKSWQSLEASLPGVDPLRAKVSRVVASHVELSRAYACLDRHHLGDFAPYVFVTEDFGASWRPLTLPPDIGWVNVLVEHPRNGDLLFAGAETGLFVTFDRGSGWQRMTGNFPRVPVDDLVIHPRDNDLVVGTHGRSIYVLDDVTPLERHRPGDDALQLFPPRRATIFLPWKHESYGAQGQFVGENPPYGVLLAFYLPRKPESDVTLQVLDADGDVVRTLDVEPQGGFHRIAWDLRTQGPEDVEDARGPLVPVGHYTVRLTEGDETREKTFPVVLDPRMDIGEAEFEDRFRFLTAVNALRARVHAALERAESLEEEAANIEAILTSDHAEDARAALKELEKSLAEAKKPIGGERPSFRDPHLAMRASRLFSELSGDDVRQGSLYGPTETQRKRLARLEREADEAIAALEETIATAVADVNQKLEALGPLRLAADERR